MSGLRQVLLIVISVEKNSTVLEKNPTWVASVIRN